MHGLKRSVVPLAVAVAVASLGAYTTLRIFFSPHTTRGASSLGPIGDVKTFAPVKILRPFPAIEQSDLTVLPASEVGKMIKPHELVLGVVVDRKARAYPINMMTGPSREIFNDQLGGQAIAATW